MSPEENDPLWKLLGQMPAPEIRGNFTQSVMEEIAAGPREAKLVEFPWWKRPSVLYAAAACVALTLSLLYLFWPKAAEEEMFVEDNSQAELHEIAYLQDLLERDEVEDFEDEDIAALLFAGS